MKERRKKSERRKKERRKLLTEKQFRKLIEQGKVSKYAGRGLCRVSLRVL